jgi:hypothetical protein
MAAMPLVTCKRAVRAPGAGDLQSKAVERVTFSPGEKAGMRADVNTI